MPRPDSEKNLQYSVLDRLIDHQPRVSREPEAERAGSLAQMKEAVKRDLEWLLNSRQVVADLPDDLREIRKSLLTYGLPDITSSSLSNPADQLALRRAVEEAVARFEPRLTQIAVTLVVGREFERALRFRIDAMLDVEPKPEPVAFDSVLQLNTKTFVVEGE